MYNHYLVLQQLSMRIYSGTNVITVWHSISHLKYAKDYIILILYFELSILQNENPKFTAIEKLQRNDHKKYYINTVLTIFWIATSLNVF